MIDAGVAARLMRVSPQKLAGLDQTSLTEFGNLLETFVKANERVSAKDRRGMRKLRDALGDRFIAGVVFSTGARSFTSDDERIHVMPVDRLWRPVP